jgi:putative flippase GtrA
MQKGRLIYLYSSKTRKQGIYFILTSGIGWIMDFSIYSLLVSTLNMNVMYSNMISALPAITYVFITSTKKIFNNNKTNMKLGYKYLIYFIYQVMLLAIVSYIGQVLFDNIIDFITYQIILKYLKIIIKLFITPITMSCNFIFMKLLIEKL